MKLQELSLERLKEIVDGAPDGAVWVAFDEVDSPYFYDSYFKFWTGSQWIGSGFNHRNISKGFKYLIKLSNIRAELLARLTQPDFAVGDLVVIKSSWKPINKLLYEIESITGTSVQVSAYIPHLHKFSRQILGFCIGAENLRTVTPEEKAIGHRIDTPVVCIEEETPELFESKHCSPRPLVDRELNVSVGQKHDQSKPRYSLIPSGSLASIVDVLEHGANKYATDNWKHVENARERYYNASMRHIQSWWTGEQNDPETGLPHLAHAVCSLMFLMALEGEQGE